MLATPRRRFAKHAAVSVIASLLIASVCPAQATGNPMLTFVANAGVFGGLAYGDAIRPALSGNGRRVIFSTDRQLDRTDSNRLDDVYLRDIDLRQITRISLAPLAIDADGASGVHGTALSADGNFAVFDSAATNLVAGDTNNKRDIFVRDLAQSSTTRVSLSSTGAEADGDSYAVAISADGRFVVFASDATNLVANDRNGMRDVFVRDRQMNTTTRVSVSSGGAEGNATSGRAAVSISDDGRFVVFDSAASTLVAGDANGVTDVFLHDRATGTTRLVSVAPNRAPADDLSSFAAISGDGRCVAFASRATNLVANDTNAVADVFVRDLGPGVTTRVSISNGGGQGDRSSGSYGVAISRDGTVVAFDSRATTLVNGYVRWPHEVRLHVRDRLAGTTTGRSFALPGYSDRNQSATRGLAVSATGEVIAFTAHLHSSSAFGAFRILVADANPRPNPDPIGGTVDRASPAGGTPMLSRDGRMLAFDDGQQIQRFDRVTGTIMLISADQTGQPGNDASRSAHVSSDGRYTVFESRATNLVPSDLNQKQDVFVKDAVTGVVQNASVSTTGVQAGAPSEYPTISADGSRVLFSSGAGNLVPNDTNGRTDVFLRDLAMRTTTRVSVSSTGAEANTDCFRPRMSACGGYATFISSATNLVSRDTNGNHDAFLRDIATGITTRVNVDSSGAQSVGSADWPDVSANGTVVVFESSAADLVPNDTNNRYDIFAYDTRTKTTTRVSVDWMGREVYRDSVRPSVSPNGRWVAFTSDADLLDRNDRNGAADVFVHDLQTGITRLVSVDDAGQSGTGASGGNAVLTHTAVTDQGTVSFGTLARNIGGGGLIIRDTYPRVTTTGPVRPGAVASLALESPADAGRAYQAAAALATTPGIAIDRRRIPLRFDAMTFFSLTAPWYWRGFKGQLDAQGNGSASFAVPADARLAGVNLYVAFVVLDATAPSGVRAISNAAHVQPRP